MKSKISYLLVLAFLLNVQTTFSQEETVLEYQKWNMKNPCTIKWNYDENTKPRFKIVGIDEWISQLRQTGFFTENYLNEKKLDYQDVQKMSDNAQWDPDFQGTRDHELFDKIIADGAYSFCLTKILIEDADINGEKATVIVKRFHDNITVSRTKKDCNNDLGNQTNIVVTTKEDFETNSKSPFNTFKVILVRKNGKWLINTARPVNKTQ